MTDIVERLRIELLPIRRSFWSNHALVLLEEAADTIEVMAREIAELKARL